MPRHVQWLATAAIAFSQLVLAGSAAAAEPFPWKGPQALSGKGGELVWTVTRSEGELTIEGRHPRWSVRHTCAPDGTPRKTVKTVGKRVTQLVWTGDGVEYTFDLNGKGRSRKVAERNLWDGDTLDARLAGLDWATASKREFRIIDTDKESGDVVPMKAFLEKEEACSVGRCRHVVLRYDGAFAFAVAPWHYRYGVGEDAPYVAFDHEQESFKRSGK